MKSANGWLVIDDQFPVLCREYRFGPGMATTLVIGMGEHRLLAVSPGCKLGDAAHEELKAHGEVTALVAPNRFHHLGIGEWLKRWPEARAYAGEQSLRRLNEKCSAGAVFAPLSQLPPLRAGIHIDNPPGMKNTDLVLRVRTGRGWVWYINDLLMNMRELPKNSLARLMLAVAGMKKGLCAPRMARMLNVRDRKAVGLWLFVELDAKPPAVVVFGHGDPLSGNDPGARLRSVIEAGF
jgi:hypothetical protein